MRSGESGRAAPGPGILGISKAWSHLGRAGKEGPGRLEEALLGAVAMLTHGG